MSWDYCGEHWYEVAWWYFRSWVCDNLGLNCPTCAEADRLRE